MLVTGGDNGREKRKRPEAEEVAWSDRGKKVFHYRKDVGRTVSSTWDAMLKVIVESGRCTIRNLAVNLGWVPKRGGQESRFDRQSVLMDVLGKWWKEDMGQSVKWIEYERRRSYFLYIDPDTVQQIKTVVQATFRPDEVLEDTEVKARLVEAGVLAWCGDQRQVAMVDRSLACIACWKREWTTLDHCMDVEGSQLGSEQAGSAVDDGIRELRDVQMEVEGVPSLEGSVDEVATALSDKGGEDMEGSGSHGEEYWGVGDGDLVNDVETCSDDMWDDVEAPQTPGGEGNLAEAERETEFGGGVVTNAGMEELVEEESEDEEEAVTEDDHAIALAITEGQGKRTTLCAFGEDHPSGLTLEEVCAQELLSFVNGTIGRDAFDEHLARVFYYMGGNRSNRYATNFPKSLYHLKKILRTVDAWDTTIHYCPFKCRCFTDRTADDPDGKVRPTKKTEWVKLTDVVCGEIVVNKQGTPEVDAEGNMVRCTGKRFKKVTLSRKETLTPKAYFFWFGVTNIIKNRFKHDLKFCEARSRYEARAKENGDVWSGKLVEHIDRLVDNQLCAEDVVVASADRSKMVYRRKGGLYEPGYDHAQPFKRDKKQHSTGFMYLKMADTPPMVSC